jgi:diaminopimelate decarboxylase
MATMSTEEPLFAERDFAVASSALRVPIVACDADRAQTSAADSDGDAFNRRISIDEASAMVRSALREQLLHNARSAIFHDLGLMRARIEALQAAFPSNTLHAVAIKANPLLEVLRAVVQAGCGLEAASIEEVELAKAAGCPAERIVFDSPAKTIEEIRDALRLGVILNVDNFDELDRVAAAYTAVRSRSIVGIRVNAMVGGGTIQHTSVSLATSKFGIPLQSNRQQIVEAFARYEWLNALHVHVGSQGCGLPLLIEAAERISNLRHTIVSETGRRVAHIDLGGGLSTVYRTGHIAPTPAEYRIGLEQTSPDLFDANTQLITELGRAIHANCGIAASRVEYVKPAQRLAVIHLGADFLLRPVYRAEDWRHEFFVLDRQGAPKTGLAEPISIAGPLCFSGDVVAREILLPPVEEGDWIVIRDVGAYTLSMWSRHCSRGIPVVVGFDPQASESLRILRRSELPSDVVLFWS